MATNYKFNNGGTITDFSDAFIPRSLFSTGGAWAWGQSGGGGLGDNTSVNKSSPVQTVAGGTNWKQVAMGGYLTTTQGAGIKTDGTLWVWGNNNYGGLGDNTITNRSSPVQTVAAGTNWRYVSQGRNLTAAIKTDGTLWLWGKNTNGQLGDNTVTAQSSPVQTVAAGTNWKQVSSGYRHTSAIKTDGTLWTWGHNNNGQLGDNTTTAKSSPVQTVSGGTNWRQVCCGRDMTAAIKTDGTLWLWGTGSQGILGDNTTTAKSSPVQTVAGGTNWKQVSAGVSFTAAIRTDGTLWTWGLNINGQLGDNTTTPKSSPVQTVAAGTNWKQVTVGQSSAAIKTDGTLWTWGLNGNGQLGDNTIVNKSSPVQTIAAGTNWKQVSCGPECYSFIALTDIF